MNTALIVLCLAGGGTIGQPEGTVFKAPRIEVKTRAQKDKTFFFTCSTTESTWAGNTTNPMRSPDLPRLCRRPIFMTRVQSGWC